MVEIPRRYVWGMAGLSLGFCCLASSLAAADKVPAEDRLPPGVSVFISVPDAVDFSERFHETGFGRLLRDDALAEVRADVEEYLNELSTKVEELVGVPLADVCGIIHGEVAFAVLHPAGRDPGAALFLDFGENSETLDTLLGKAAEAIEADGATRTVETVQDTEVTIFTTDDEKTPEFAKSLCHFIKDQQLIVTTSTAIAEEILQRWDGEHDETFGRSEVYGGMMEKCRTADSGEPQVKWYFSPVDLFRTITSIPEANQGPVSPSVIMGFLPALGLDRVKAVGGTSSMATDEFDSISRTLLYVEAPATGIVKMFACPAVSQQPPRWVPESSAGYTVVNWDIENAYKTVESLVDFFQPPGTLAKLLDQIAQQGPKVHVKDDVIDAISGRMHFLAEEAEDLEFGEMQPFVIALELRDEARLADVLQRVQEVAGDQLETRDFRGLTIYEVEIPGVSGAQTLGACIAKGNLFFATDVERMEAYLRSENAESPLIESTDYRRVASHFPGETSLLGFQRPAAQVRPLYDVLRSGQLEAVFDQVDFTRLPEFEVIEHYFSVAGGYAVSDPQGALFVNFSLHAD
jgi:hypothetical protein